MPKVAHLENVMDVIILTTKDKKPKVFEWINKNKSFHGKINKNNVVN